MWAKVCVLWPPQSLTREIVKKRRAMESRAKIVTPGAGHLVLPGQA